MFVILQLNSTDNDDTFNWLTPRILLVNFCFNFCFINTYHVLFTALKIINQNESYNLSNI